MTTVLQTVVVRIYFEIPTISLCYIIAEDFVKGEQVITIQASDAPSPEQDVIFDLIDDIFLERPEEDFLALMQLESAAFPDLVEIDPDMRLALCRIRSDDCTSL